MRGNPMAALLALITLAGPVSADSSACAPTRLETPDATAEGHCSVTSMIAGVNGAAFPVNYRALSGVDVVPPPDSERWRTSDAAFPQAPFPGEGWLRFSGLIDSNGTTCNHHVQAITVPRGDADADPVTPGKLEALPEPMRERVREAERRLNRERGGGPTEGSRSVIFEVFSPQAGLRELGVEESIPAALDGTGQGTIAGWPAGSYASFAITLPGVRPAELQAGASYPAEVRGVDPHLLRQWRGQIQRFANPRQGRRKAAIQRICQRGMEAVARKWQQYPEIVNAAQERGCSESRVFTGTRQRLSARQLTGTVAIVDISDGRIRARFELAGTGRLEIGRYQLTRADNPKGDIMGQPDPSDERLRHVRRETVRTGPIHLRGYLRAPNHTANRRLSPNDHPRGGAQPMLDARTVVLAEDRTGSGAGPLQPEAPFGIASHQPARERRNVHRDAPGIRVAFNRPIDAASVSTDAVRVATGTNDNGMIRARTRVVPDGERAVRVQLDRPLKDGVHYRVTVVGGPEGIYSREGDTLGQDYRWHFATMVDLDREQRVYQTGDHLTGERGIEPHVFQVSRDAALVPGKNTLTRVYTKWRGHAAIAPRWQVQHFDADVAVHGDNRLYQTKPGERLERPDQWQEAQRVHAETSVNFHGWFPRRADGDQLVATVQPVDQCVAEPTVFRSDPLPVTYTPQSPTLALDYYIVRAGDWAGNALTRGAHRWAPAMAHPIAARGASFTTQNFPITDTRLSYRGTITLGDKGWGQAANDQLSRQRPDERIIERLRPRLNNDSGGADAVVLFMGSDILAEGGYAYQEATGSQPGITAVFLDRDRLQPVRKGSVDVAHELGHVMMASDRHYDRAQWTGNYDATHQRQIEGFRLPRLGPGGRNKSHAEGNASPDGSRLYPLMMAGQMLEGATFITNNSYDDLIEQLTHPPSRLTSRHRPPRLAARGTGTNQTTAATWTVHGLIQPSGPAAAITDIAPTRGAADETPPESPWRAVLTNGAGERLASTPLNLQPPLKPGAGARPQRFTAVLPRAAEAWALRIQNADEIRARRQRTPNRPRLTVDTPTVKGDRVQLNWRASDPDPGDTLSFDVAYSADGAVYRPLAVGLDRQRLSVAIAELTPGDNPQLRISASDGFNTHVRRVPVSATGDWRVLTTLPSDGAVITPEQAIAVLLNGDALDTHSIALRDSDSNQPVPGRVAHQRDGGRIEFIPQTPLAPGRYTAVLNSNGGANKGRSVGGHARWRFEVKPASEQTDLETQHGEP